MNLFKALSIVSLLMFSSVSFGAGMCSDLFQEDTVISDEEKPLTLEEEQTLSEAAKISEEVEEQNGALKKIAIQHLYEKAITFLQTKVTGTSIRSTEALKNRRKLQLIGFLKGGKYSEAINIYRHVFENVELSFHRINQDMGTIERLRAQPELDKSDMANLQMRLQVYQRRFAASYGEYISIRTYLEKLGSDPAIDAVTAETAQKTLRDSDVIYKKFYDRMLEAEAKALKMGDISIFDKDSNIDNMIVVIQTGLILKYVGPTVFQSGTELYSYVLTVLGAQ